MLPDTLRQELRYIELYTARRIRNAQVGTYTSRSAGTGFDFREHRPYAPGDDVRRIDWNVTARLRTPFIRLTDAERDLTLIVAIDVSPSMGFASHARSKRDAMLTVAGCLVFSALADRINIGMLAFADRVVGWFPPRNNRAYAWDALDQIWSLDVRASATRLAPAAEVLARRLRKTSMVCVVSDFLMTDDWAERPDIRMLSARHDVLGVVVEDPAEADLPEGSGVVRLRDLESGRGVRVALGLGVRARYRAARAERRRRLDLAFRRASMSSVHVASNQSAVEPLLQEYLTRRLQ